MNLQTQTHIFRIMPTVGGNFRPCPVRLSSYHLTNAVSLARLSLQAVLLVLVVLLVVFGFMFLMLSCGLVA